jgi:Gp37 protein
VAATALDTLWTGGTFEPPTPIDIATIEVAIVNQLRSVINTIEIAHYPDRPESYRLTHRIGAALVRYDGAKYGPLLDTAAIVQQRRLGFEITVMTRDLGWSFGGQMDGTSPGAYAIIEAVRAALTGFQIPGCTKMFPQSEKFVERDKQGAVWIYTIAFALTTMAVEPSSTDASPLFIKGAVLEEGGITSTVVEALFTFDSDGQIDLPQGNVTQLTISNPESGTAYRVGTDYSLDAVNGIICRNPEGSIAGGASVEIAYCYSDTVIALASGGNVPTAPTN